MTTTSQARTRTSGMAIWKAVLLTLPILLWLWLLMGSWISGGDARQAIAGALSWAAFGVLFALMLIKGRTYRYRSLLFILIAFALPMNFIPNMIETHGSMALSEGSFIECSASFCPLAFPQIVFPAAITRTVIFPSTLWGATGIIGMSVLLIGASLTTGRGWCSWGCFYGGWDEFFARLPKKARIRHIDRRWIYLPFAVLLVVVLTSAIALSPTYCGWACPYKVVTEFAAPANLLAIVQMVLFIAVFIGLVIVLPLLTKRRVQCGLFCPLGAWQSFWNKINIFDLRIDKQACSQCKRCIRECPTFSLDEGSLESGKPLITCTRCGKCVDVCPQGAISYHIKGTQVGVRPNVARVLYMYPAFILMSTLGSGIVAMGLWRLMLLVTTGSMVQ